LLSLFGSTSRGPLGLAPISLACGPGTVDDSLTTLTRASSGDAVWSMAVMVTMGSLASRDGGSGWDRRLDDVRGRDSVGLGRRSGRDRAKA